ncbi:hypothetical protein ALC56_10186 [Trachymyrmex septentrionalis]|uniref:Uncharacterized protein n=1 Tax=Trachymyrmex septentrionalis TaxID=34720 RepID=A0A195F5G3_9HYME|nr:hypothetical protein ALC56_10186 [Trachymyrmex septentrionalis]
MCVQPVAGGRQPTNRGKIMGRSSFVHVGGSMLSAFTFREFRVINRRAGDLSPRLDYAISKPSTLKLWDNYVVSLSDRQPFNPDVHAGAVKKREGAAVGYFILEGSICLPYLAWENVKILDEEKVLDKRLISKAIHVKQQSLNLQNDTYSLDPLYMNLFTEL